MLKNFKDAEEITLPCKLIFQVDQRHTVDPEYIEVAAATESGLIACLLELLSRCDIKLIKKEGESYGQTAGLSQPTQEGE